MNNTDTVIAVFHDHAAAEVAVKQLAKSGFDIRHLSVIGRGYHTEEVVTGFYNTGDRIRFWGRRGAVWGGLWGLFFGGLFITVPVVGPVVVLGYLASMAISVVEGAVVVGGLSAVGAALFGLGMPKDSVIAYEAVIAADRFLVLAHGPAAEMTRAKALLSQTTPESIEMHAGPIVLAPSAAITA